MDDKKLKVIRVGSRKSELALIQTKYVIECLKKVYPDVEFEIVTMTTLGDRILNVSLPKIGEKSLFTKDLEDSLRNNTVDFVVHSLKDLPTTLPDGLGIGAVFEREDPRDALVMRKDLKNHNLKTLPADSCVGTSSLRRTAQLRGLYPHLKIVDVRGNLNTRLKKLNTAADNIKIDLPDSTTPYQEYSALILAQSGLMRLGKKDEISEVLSTDTMMYAVGQGALAVECRTQDRGLLGMLSKFNHEETYLRVLAERSFLKTLGGGCSAPVGVTTHLEAEGNGYSFIMCGAVWSIDGKTKVDDSIEVSIRHFKSKSSHKRQKIETGNTVQCGNPIEEYNLKISQKIPPLNCEDLGCMVYCGMTENYNIRRDAIQMFECLGIDLAKILIDKGALEVMKVTQDMIRASISR